MSSRRMIHGVATSPGLAIGPVHIVRTTVEEVPTWSVAEEDLAREIERLRQAILDASEEMRRRQKVVSAQAGEMDAQIFAVHRMILQDPAALAKVEGSIREQRINAEAAVQILIRGLESTLGGMEGDSVRGYAADLSDPWHAVQEALMQKDRETMFSALTPVVVASAELSPQVMTLIERGRMLGVIAETGGRFSHAAVLARAFGVPCVIGLPGLLSRLEQGMSVIVDGSRGTVQLRPEESDVQTFALRKSQLEARQEVFARESALPAETPDGVRMGIQVNVESLRDLDMFDPLATDGLGLVRTEFLYMERPQFPSEDEQFRLYRRVLERMQGRPVTLRTLDIGGDKRLPYFKTPEEPNPALGWRGVRIALEWRDLLRVQLRAALRAGVGHNLRIMLPMVTSLEEVRSVHEIFDGVRASLVSQGYEVESNVPVGIMVEVPSALFVLEEILQEVDFVSVGTNDLVQYLLAVDRDNPWVAKLYEPHHPAVLRALSMVARASMAAGRSCSVCGDVADDPAFTILLLGLGFDAVSVAPAFRSEIKYAVRHTLARDARSLADRALKLRDAQSVRALLDELRASLGNAG